MKLNFEDYKQFCSKNNLKECYYTSLARFVKEVKIEKEISLIKKHTAKLEKLSNNNEIAILGGVR